MNISFVCVGSIKESFYKEAIQEYRKRLSKYCKCNIIEVKDEKTPDKASELEERKVKQKEGEKILAKIKDNSYVIALAIQGKKLDSIVFAEYMQKIAVQSKSNLIFIIGGSLGLSEEVLQRADFQLSFSDMTFPHQLMRVILLEQIYRAYRIQNHEPYHK